MITVWFFLVVPWVCLQFVIVVFPDHTQLLSYIYWNFVHMHTGIMYTSICWYLRVLPVLHRPEVVDIGVNTT